LVILEDVCFDSYLELSLRARMSKTIEKTKEGIQAKSIIAKAM
jgi:hypothetical protein